MIIALLHTNHTKSHTSHIKGMIITLFQQAFLILPYPTLPYPTLGMIIALFQQAFLIRRSRKKTRYVFVKRTGVQYTHSHSPHIQILVYIYLWFMHMKKQFYQKMWHVFVKRAMGFIYTTHHSQFGLPYFIVSFSSILFISVYFSLFVYLPSSTSHTYTCNVFFIIVDHQTHIIFFHH